MGITLRHPDLPAENAAQTGNTNPGDIGHAPVEIVFCQGPFPESLVILFGVGIVVTRNPPDFGEFHRVFEHQIHRRIRLHVSQKHDRLGVPLFHRFVDVIKAAVRVAAKENQRRFLLSCG